MICIGRLAAAHGVQEPAGAAATRGAGGDLEAREGQEVVWKTKRGERKRGKKQIEKNNQNNQKIDLHLIPPFLIPPFHSPEVGRGAPGQGVDRGRAGGREARG